MRMMTRLLIATTLLVGVLTGAAAQEPYRIRVGDRVAISVLEDPSIGQQTLVLPDGSITLPIAGRIVAEGLTPTELQNAVRRALSGVFIEAPTVTATVVGLGGELEIPQRIYVLGQVARPGPIDITLPLDILQALSLAGGPGVFAATDRIQLRRQSADGSSSLFLFNYDLVEDGVVPIRQLSIEPGDVIVVPERGLFE